MSRTDWYIAFIIACSVWLGSDIQRDRLYASVLDTAAISVCVYRLNKEIEEERRGN